MGESTPSTSPPTAAPTTAERVQAAALTLFAERGYHGTGIRQLADAAGLSSASLYHYMGTKEELLVAIMRSSLTRLVAAGEEICADPALTVRERLVALVELHVRTHARSPQETRVVDDEVRALSAGARTEIVALRDRYEALWQATIDEGVRSGAFRVENPALARRALLEMCSGVARWWVPSGPLTLTDLADEYATMAVHLVRA